jgi:hypothetical protein
MNLATRNYLTIDAPPLEPEAPEMIEFGWPAVRQGLHSILLGYLLSLGMALFAVALALLAAFSVPQVQQAGEFLDAAMLLYFGIGVLFLMGLGSLALVIKGNVRCLVNAPERCGARWLMFASTLCVVVGPALNLVSALVLAPPKPAALTKRSCPAEEMVLALHRYGDSFLAQDTRAYVALTGGAASLLSGVFFVLFLRAVARCFDDTSRMRVTEFYLLFNGLLTAASVYCFLHPLTLLANLHFAVALVGAWVTSALGYLLLLLNTSACIFEGLARRRPALEG